MVNKDVETSSATLPLRMCDDQVADLVSTKVKTEGPVHTGSAPGRPTLSEQASTCTPSVGACISW